MKRRRQRSNNHNSLLNQLKVLLFNLHSFIAAPKQDKPKEKAGDKKREERNQTTQRNTMNLFSIVPLIDSSYYRIVYLINIRKHVIVS